MKQRLRVHLSILLLSVLISKTFSILPFILPISIISIIGACRNKNRNFDSIDMFWLLFQLSFVTAPAYSLNEIKWDVLFSKGVIVEYAFGQVLIYQRYELLMLFAILILVALINLIFLPSQQSESETKNTQLRIGLPLLFAILYTTFLVDIQLRGGIENTMAARHARELTQLSIFAIFSTSIFLVIFWLTAIKLKNSTRKEKVIGIIALILPAYILYNPFNAPRFSLIQAWLPFILIFWPKIRRFSIFFASIAVGVIVLMPILSLTTRYGAGSDMSIINFSATAYLEFLDQHTVALHLVDMVDRHGYQLGSSTMSVLGFFIPRVFWSEKPEVIGLEVGKELFAGQYVGTSNLSGPIFLDFYYDFGLIGVAFGSVLTALFFRSLLRNGGRVNDVPLVNYIVLAALPIVFRGSVGAVIGVVFFSLIFYYLIVHMIDKMQ